jgi:hypothetical protein
MAIDLELFVISDGFQLLTYLCLRYINITQAPNRRVVFGIPARRRELFVEWR